MHVTYSMRISSITCIKKTTHTPLLLSTVHCWNCTELAPVIDLITSSSQESRQIAKRIPLSCLESVFFFMTCSRQLWCGGARSVRRTWWRTYEEGVGGAVVRQELHRLRVEPEPKSHGQHQQAWQLRNKDQHGNHPLSRKRTKKSNFKTLLKHGSCFHVTCLVTSPEKTEAHRGVVFFFFVHGSFKMIKIPPAVLVSFFSSVQWPLMLAASSVLSLYSQHTRNANV